MLSIGAVFARYVAHHQQLSLSSKNLSGKRLNRLGRIEKAMVQGQYLTLSGWTYLDQLVVSHANQTINVTPNEPREDVQQEFGTARDPGFHVTLHYKNDAVVIIGDGVHFEVSQPSTLQNWRQKAVLAARFTKDCMRCAALVLSYKRAQTLQEKAIIKQRVKVRLGFDVDVGQSRLAPSIPDDAFQSVPVSSVPMGEIVIVVPVYNAFDVLQDCIARVIQHTDVPWHLVIVNDKSSDERVAPYLQDLAQGPQADHITFLQNAENLGFVGTANKGLAVAARRGGHVVLLNSDALVPAGWAPRLMAPFADPSVASVTPFSNDAELMSMPCIVAPTALLPGVGDEIDRVVNKILAHVAPVAAPTGVGFCMAISAEWLRRFPAFDTIFGRGYGEEVDWCRKILAQGGSHVVTANLFVEHRGGQSFGSAEKAARISANNEIISKRYPEFDAEVQTYIQSDPLICGRLVQALVWASHSQSAPLAVIVAHSLGGGADDATARNIEQLLAKDLSAVVVRLGGDLRFVVELHCTSGITKAALQSRKTLDIVLSAIGDMDVVYGCGVGDPHPLEIPDLLVDWATWTPASTLEIQFHDYFPISPSYTLLDHDGHYQGVPIGGSGSDPAHCFKDTGGQVTALRDWQAGWGRAVAVAKTIRVYNQASADIVTAVWPVSVDRLLIKGHAALFAVSGTQRIINRPAKTIGVLGNLGRQKGAAVVSDLSKLLRKNDVARLIVIGNVDPHFPIDKGVIMHGSYRREDIPYLVDHYALDGWFIPSIWPETFSFTTHEAIATQLPVWSFDLGGQAEAIAAAHGRDRLIALNADVPTIARQLFSKR